MKLYLHWLRHDLRRFRLILALWSLAVVGYAVFLGWLHSRILHVQPSAADWSGWAELVLVIQAFLLALFLLGSDPAGGARAFWKTRPPSGFSIAAVKLTLVAGFLLALPMLAWLTVRFFCVLPGYAVREPGEPLSLTGGLWWALALMISLCALASASVPGSGGRAALMRLAQLVCVCFLLFLFSRLNTIFAEHSDLQWPEIEALFRGARSLTMSLLALAAGAGLFLAARRSRTPWRGTGTTALLTPPLLVILTFLTVRPAVPRHRDESLPRPDAAAAGKMKITPAPPGWPQMERTGGAWADIRRRESAFGFYRFTLRMEGLPPGMSVQGRWLDLRLTAADGRTVSMDPALFSTWPERPGNSLPESDRILSCTAAFWERDLRPVSLRPCRAEGRLRLTLSGKHGAALPLNERGTMENALGRFRFRPPYPSVNPSSRFDVLLIPSLSLILRQPAPRIDFTLRHESGNTLGLQSRSWRETTGTRLEYTLIQLDFQSDPRNRPRPDPRTRPGATTPPVENWSLLMSWFTPEAALDLPVVIPAVLMPAFPGDERNPSELLAGLELPPALSPPETLLRLKHALQLIVQPDANDADAPARLTAWEALLAKVTRAQLPALLDLCEETGEAGAFHSPEDWEAPLRRRTAELLQPADSAAIRSRPALLRYLGEVPP